MVRIGRILRATPSPSSVDALLSLWGFVDDTAFLTEGGARRRRLYRVRTGVDYEGLSHAQRQMLVHRLEAGLRLLDEHCRVYQYIVKRSIDPIIQLSLPPGGRTRGHPAPSRVPERAAPRTVRCLALPGAYEAPHVVEILGRARGRSVRPQGGATMALNRGGMPRRRSPELDRAIGTLHHKAQAFEVQLSDIGPTRLQKKDAFAFFRQLVNYEPSVAASV